MGKVDFRKPAAATPHGRVAFVRFGAESCARRARKKCQNGVAKVLIAGTRPLGRRLFFSLKNFQKKRKNKYKNLLKNVTGRRRKREEEEQEHQKTNGKKRGKASTLYILTPDRPPQRPHINNSNNSYYWHFPLERAIGS